MTGQISPDGKWLWDGYQWIPNLPQPVPPLAAPVIETSTQPPAFTNVMGTNIANNDFVKKSSNGKEISTKTKIIFAVGTVFMLLIGAGLWLYLGKENACQNVLLSRETDDPLGGIIDTTTTYSYNEQGLKTLEEEVSWDGTILDTTTYTYNDDGNRIEEYRVFEGEWSREKMTYDSSGMILTKDTQDSYSWSDDERKIYTYDSDGNLVKLEIDYLIDGVVDEVTEYQYNSEGLEKFSYTDSDMDGNYDSSTTSLYDSEDRILEERVDEAMDGTVDDIYLYRYDSNGNWIEWKIDYGNDGDYESTLSMTYDSNNVLTSQVDTTDFGWFYSRASVTYEYADDGSYTATLSIFDRDGQTSTIFSEYGCLE